MPATAAANPPLPSSLRRVDERSETRMFLAKIPPAKVEVAVVEVALIAATCGVEVDTTLPDASVERSILAPVPWRVRVEVEISVPTVRRPAVVEDRYELTL